MNLLQLKQLHNITYLKESAAKVRGDKEEVRKALALTDVLTRNGWLLLER